MGACGEDSGAPQDTALSPGPPAHLLAPRPEGLEGPREKAMIPLSPHSLLQGPLQGCWWSGSLTQAQRTAHPPGPYYIFNVL